MKTPTENQQIALAFGLFCLLSFLAASVEASDQHKIYVGTHWTHLSNVDAGLPFNNNPEDNADHIGIDLEYQYHANESEYVFFSIGVGKSRFNSANGGSGWDCSGCYLPSTLRIGYKLRLY